MNFILLATGMLVVIVGFILMGGDASTADAYNPDIFSARRTKVAPLVCLFGFVSMIYAVVYKSKDGADEQPATPVSTTTETPANDTQS